MIVLRPRVMGLTSISPPGLVRTVSLACSIFLEIVSTANVRRYDQNFVARAP